MGAPYPVAALDVSDRRNVYYWTAKTLAMLGHRFLVRPHVEMDDDVAALKRRGDAVFLYCGLHKSLWETSGVLPPLHLAGLPVPYVGMGDNLVKGRAFQHLSWKIGAFLVRRPANRKEMLESARKLRDDVLSFLANGLDVMVGDGSGKPRTLHGLDSLSMIRNIGDTYLSYGKPVRVADHLLGLAHPG